MDTAAIELTKVQIENTLSLSQRVRHEVEQYAGVCLNCQVYFFADDELLTYTVVDIPHDRDKLQAGIVVMARIVGDKIVIEVDNTDKPLLDALMHNVGIPREQIILAYAGEKVPVLEA
jgi:hypothetical protein